MPDDLTYGEQEQLQLQDLVKSEQYLVSNIITHVAAIDTVAEKISSDCMENVLFAIGGM